MRGIVDDRDRKRAAVRRCAAEGYMYVYLLVSTCCRLCCCVLLLPLASCPSAPPWRAQVAGRIPGGGLAGGPPSLEMDAWLGGLCRKRKRVLMRATAGARDAARCRSQTHSRQRHLSLATGPPTLLTPRFRAARSACAPGPSMLCSFVLLFVFVVISPHLFYFLACLRKHFLAPSPSPPPLASLVLFL